MKRSIFWCLAIILLAFAAADCDGCDRNCDCADCPDDDVSLDDDLSIDDDDTTDDDTEGGDIGIDSVELTYVAGGNFSGAGLTRLSSGRHAVASYRGRRLLVYTEDVAGWEEEVVAFGIYANPAIAATSDDALWLVFQDWREKQLLYATNESGEWVLASADDTYRVGHYSAAAAGADGRVYAVYNAEDAVGTSVEIRMVTFTDGAPGTPETVAAGDGVGRLPAVAVSGSGAVAVGYNTASTIALAWRDAASTTWSRSALPGGRPQGRAVGLAFDGTGELHAVYHNDAAASGLNHTYGHPGAWTTETIPAAVDVGDTTAMTVDGNGAVHVVYYSPSTSAMYGNNATGDWEFSALGAGEPIYIAAGSTTDVAVAIGGLGIWRKLGDTWETAFYFGHSYEVSDTAVTSREAAAELAFMEENTRSVWHARASSGAWESVPIAINTGAGGLNLGLVTDPAGAVHAGFYDGTVANLRHLTDEGGAWTGDTVDDSPFAGTQHALAIAPEGTLHVSYFDQNEIALKHAWNDGAGWQHETVDEDGIVGVWSDIAVAADGVVYIVYQDLTHASVKLAEGGGAWTIKTLADVDGQYVAICLDGLAQPHVAFYLNGAVQYMGWWDDQWHTHTLQYPAAEGEVAIAPFQDGIAVVYPTFMNELIVAAHEGGAWAWMLLDTLGEAGGHVSVANLSGDRLAIGYVAQTSLWLATIE